ncbi:helix-turn-helix domain-containing protein [Actinoplanes awajinensis]|uniref:TetR family transcriptional regulator n=1 Tax=Actinoplanes awajinensis subsp. mycoplanecinus TaxID=135947 RepID=A0A101JDK8_9ACTN|nr:helix-turn-helix domain-containing protein [Actinoplanes awajinensis]KUL24785.1 TetR family transcriptional regulator [Actinoplanes awajinensis subsp. mycoplanecinus]
MPRVSQDQLDARRHEILTAARGCFARFGYEGATVRRLEEATGMSRGAIFHHFRDKESLFLAVAEDDAATMVETVARDGLVQVMRDLLALAGGTGAPATSGTVSATSGTVSATGGPGESDDSAREGDTAGWLGTQLEVSHRLRTDPAFAKRWAQRSAAIADATHERLQRQREAGVLRQDVPVDVLTQFLELAYDGLVLHLATGRPPGDLARVLDLVEDAVRHH